LENFIAPIQSDKLYCSQMLKPYYDKQYREAGVDEAGRGCLAGPVVAAAVILPPDSALSVDDSKKLTATQRLELRQQIIRHALAYCVAQASAEEIDRLNILNATFLAMHRAIAGLSLSPQLLLIDGNRFKPFACLPHHCIIQGDAQYQSIAAASILAKTWRDEYMQNLDNQYPAYGWARNVGYPTAQHRRAVIEHGFSPHHRKSFRVSLPEISLF
jgi:ribonuclease HII